MALIFKRDNIKNENKIGLQHKKDYNKILGYGLFNSKERKERT